MRVNEVMSISNKFRIAICLTLLNLFTPKKKFTNIMVNLLEVYHLVGWGKWWPTLTAKCLSRWGVFNTEVGSNFIGGIQVVGFTKK